MTGIAAWGRGIAGFLAVFLGCVGPAVADWSPALETPVPSRLAPEGPAGLRELLAADGQPPALLLDPASVFDDAAAFRVADDTRLAKQLGENLPKQLVSGPTPRPPPAWARVLRGAGRLLGLAGVFLLPRPWEQEPDGEPDPTSPRAPEVYTVHRTGDPERFVVRGNGPDPLQGTHLTVRRSEEQPHVLVDEEGGAMVNLRRRMEAGQVVELPPRDGAPTYAYLLETTESLRLDQGFPQALDLDTGERRPLPLLPGDAGFTRKAIRMA